MGYTHYFYHKRAFTDAEWKAICDETHRIVTAATAAGLQLAWANGDGLPEIDGEPLPSDGDVGRIISLNGQAPLDHEPLNLTQKPDPQLREHEPGEGRFAFCKTARKPYDAVVVSILAAIRETAPDAMTIRSDGGDGAITKHF
jgi:hypothetical protein